MQAALPNVKPFLDADFLLDNRMAQVLYHDYAKHQPIIDYHNHLPPDEIAENKVFENLTQVWLYGDHYKWRAMRTMGVDEKYITGDASDKEKFLKWAETVPFTIRNPLFHWTHLELKRYFGIEAILSPKTAEAIYEKCNELLLQGGFSTHGLLSKMNVEVVCSTDDPIDSLEHHQAHHNSNSALKMYPAFRPDKAILIEKETYNAYINQLEKAVGMGINTFDDLLIALKNRIEFFDSQGCRISDHGLEKVYAHPFTHQQLSSIFAKRRSGKEITAYESQQFMSGLMHELGQLYANKGWVMQLHLGAKE